MFCSLKDHQRSAMQQSLDAENTAGRTNSSNQTSESCSTASADAAPQRIFAKKCSNNDKLFTGNPLCGCRNK